MSNHSSFWKTSLADIKQNISNLNKGKVSTLGLSAGGREIFLVEYGRKQNMKRRANYSSACGAGSSIYYADKIKTGFLPEDINLKAENFNKHLNRACKERGLKFNGREDDTTTPWGFNLSSAIHHVCGAVSIVYESNIGLKEEGAITAEEILEEHLVLFEEMMRSFESE